MFDNTFYKTKIKMKYKTTNISNSTSDFRLRTSDFGLPTSDILINNYKFFIP